MSKQYKFAIWFSDPAVAAQLKAAAAKHDLSLVAYVTAAAEAFERLDDKRRKDRAREERQRRAAGIPLRAVSDALRRRENRGAQTTPRVYTACPICGEQVAQPRTGRPAELCGKRICRHYKEKYGVEKGPAMYAVRLAYVAAKG